MAQTENVFGTTLLFVLVDTGTDMATKDHSLRTQLKLLGFSDKEIDTYTALLSQGEAKASDIAQAAGVSKRHVYNRLGHFEERGLIEINDHEKPITARAIDPSIVIKQLSEQLSSLEKQLEEIHQPDTNIDRRYEVIKSNATVRKRISELIQDADNEVNLSLPATLISDLADVLRDAVDRGVLTLILVNTDGSETVSTDDLRGLGHVVRVWEYTGPILVCIDRYHGLFCPPEIVVSGQSEQQAISFTEDRLSPLLVGSFLGNYWPLAEEVYVHEPDPLPMTYDRFRHAVLNAALHKQQDIELFAEIEARSTQSRDEHAYETRRGHICEINQKLIKPTTNTIPIENSFVIDDGEDTYSVGGPGAILEDLEARTITLDEVPDDTQSVEALLERSSILRNKSG